MIPEIRINGERIVIPSIGEILGRDPINNIKVSNVRKVDIPETFLYAPSVVPPVAPVTVNVGKPIVDMPG